MLFFPDAIATQKLYSSPIDQVLSLTREAEGARLLHHPSLIPVSLETGSRNFKSDIPAAGDRSMATSPNIPYDDFLQAFIRRIVCPPHENNVETKQAEKQMAGAGQLLSDAGGGNAGNAQIPHEEPLQPAPAATFETAGLKEVRGGAWDLFAPQMLQFENEVFEFAIEVKERSLPDCDWDETGRGEKPEWSRIYRGEFWFF